MKRRAKFERHCALAIASSELDAAIKSAVIAFEAHGSVAVVDIRGPLTQHRSPELPWDSYDAIKVRVADAIASPARAVVLRISSPGGEVGGCFELSRDLRALAAKSGKQLIAYADGMAASAAYALACSASQIFTASSSNVGSIGVAQIHVDTTVLDRAMGLTFNVVVSGAREDGRRRRGRGGGGAAHARRARREEGGRR